MSDIRKKASQMEGLIINVDGTMPHVEMEPAQIRHNLDRISNNAFTVEEAHRYLGFAQGVALAFGWMTYATIKEINSGTYRQKIEPQSTPTAKARKQVDTPVQSAGDTEEMGEGES